MPALRDPALLDEAVATASAYLREGLGRRLRRAWNEAHHPRAKTTPRTNRGSFAPPGAKAAKSALSFGKELDVAWSSFHGDTVKVSKAQLRKAFGPPQAGPSGDGKTTAEWHFTVNGKPVALYDWKGARGEWNIGAPDAKTSKAAYKAITQHLASTPTRPATPKASPAERARAGPNAPTSTESYNAWLVRTGQKSTPATFKRFAAAAVHAGPAAAKPTPRKKK